VRTYFNLTVNITVWRYTLEVLFSDMLVYCSF